MVFSCVIRLQSPRIECALDAYQVIYSKWQEQPPALEFQNRYRSWMEASRDSEESQFEGRCIFHWRHQDAEYRQSKLLE